MKNYYDKETQKEASLKVAFIADNLDLLMSQLIPEKQALMALEMSLLEVLNHKMGNNKNSINQDLELISSVENSLDAIISLHKGMFMALYNQWKINQNINI